MITLGFIVYLIVSLKVAWDKYHEVEISYTTLSNINKCYRDVKKSLLYGFAAIPVITVYVLFFVALLLGGVYVVTSSISWIIKNMP